MNRATDTRRATPITSRTTRSRRFGFRAGRAPAALAGSFLMVLALAACTGGSPTGAGQAVATPGVVATPSEVAAPTELATAGSTRPAAASPAEDPAIAVLKQTVTDALGRLAAGTPRPATAQMTDALTGAGIAVAALEVSASRTPTGLEADAIEAAVLQGTKCVVGQVRDGSVTVIVLPVLASGKCFVGAPA
ncbi:hypothetical protein QK290_11945 [Pseudarthrobacter sp. AL07]|uniref:DUF6993 domain-containing protein n=1 Tax=unclassified Pseudarthrobacter TaxID=2647000 RepID=UPI00249A8273|nr:MULTISPECIES: hypothetical protein [unclassified Pseudarthrobacter]MDI3195136.1 hypothetical protein [Pseudarthrobacter sp. AL20]MDI3209202.1 hypothetical protein [Pseudarthrobacter sp. AL07]